MYFSGYIVDGTEQIQMKLDSTIEEMLELRRIKIVRKEMEALKLAEERLTYFFSSQWGSV